MKFNLKNKFINFKEMLKKLFEKYPLTLILIYLVTFIWAFFMDTDFVREEWFQKILMFAIVWAPGSFFAENFLEKGKKRIGTYVVTAVISYIFVHFAFLDKFEDTLIKWLVCYISSLVAGSAFLIIKKSEKDFSEYVLKVAINVVKASFVYGIIALGIAMILWIFDVLIWDITSQYIGNIEILIFGIFYSTEIIYSLINLDEEVNKFFKNLVKFVLMPLLISAFAIIYLYIIKILLLRDIPTNQIFRIPTPLFVVCGFIWTTMNYFKEEGTIYKISTKLPIIFSPFILLQIYTMGIRIVKNGVTPLRYAGMVFVLFEICYILCYILKKEKIQNLILVADVLLIITILVPGINSFDVSDFSQISNLKILNQKTDLNDQDKAKINGAYYYLKDTKKGKNYIKDNLSQEQINQIKQFNTSNSNNYRYRDYEYIYLNKKNNINIKGYNYLTTVESLNNDNKNIEKAFIDVKFRNNDNNTIASANLTNLVKEYIKIYQNEGKDKLENYFEEHSEIQINQNRKLVLYNFSIRYGETENEIDYYNIRAYLMER